MSLSVPQFRADILRTTLRTMGPKFAGTAAENLILGTIAQESGFRYLRQINGPALGLAQMEPATLDDLYTNYLDYRPAVAKAVDRFLAPIPSRREQLQSNLAYMCAVARMQYFRRPFAMPQADDIEALARIWKRRWNTARGRGTEQAFILNYHQYVATK